MGHAAAAGASGRYHAGEKPAAARAASLKGGLSAPLKFSATALRNAAAAAASPPAGSSRAASLRNQATPLAQWLTSSGSITASRSVADSSSPPARKRDIVCGSTSSPRASCVQCSTASRAARLCAVRAALSQSLRGALRGAGFGAWEQRDAPVVHGKRAVASTQRVEPLCQCLEVSRFVLRHDRPVVAEGPRLVTGQLPCEAREEIPAQVHGPRLRMHETVQHRAAAFQRAASAAFRSKPRGHHLQRRVATRLVGRRAVARQPRRQRPGAPGGERATRQRRLGERVWR